MAGDQELHGFRGLVIVGCVWSISVICSRFRVLAAVQKKLTPGQHWET